jgi:hypothetical protein
LAFFYAFNSEKCRNLTPFFVFLCCVLLVFGVKIAEGSVHQSTNANPRKAQHKSQTRGGCVGANVQRNQKKKPRSSIKRKEENKKEVKTLRY